MSAPEVTLTRAQAAHLLRDALEDLTAGRPVAGLARAYLVSVAASLVECCESDSRKRFENVAGRVLRIRPGRQPSAPNEGRRDRAGALLELDSLTIVFEVERQRRAGVPTPECFEAAAVALQCDDPDRLRKLYYRHFDGTTYRATPRDGDGAGEAPED